MLGIKEWNLDTLMFKYLWSPFKWIGKKFQFLESNIFVAVLAFTGLGFLLLGYLSPGIFMHGTAHCRLYYLVLPGGYPLCIFIPAICVKSMGVFIDRSFIYHIGCIDQCTMMSNILKLHFMSSGILLAFLLGLLLFAKNKINR